MTFAQGLFTGLVCGVLIGLMAGLMIGVAWSNWAFGRQLDAMRRPVVDGKSAPDLEPGQSSA